MKMQFIKATSKRFFFIVFIAASFYTQAQSQKNVSLTDSNATVRYLGTVDDMFVFDVHYDNVTGAKFIFEITEEANNTIFKETYYHREFEKKFKVPKEFSKVRFVIKDAKGNPKKVFVVNTNSRLYYDVVVNRISQ